MKKNIFVKILLFIPKCIEHIIFSVLFVLIFILIQPFFFCKIKGKQNLNKNDEARVFIFNHYEIYGPVIVFLRFPYKIRPWVIDKMTDPKEVEKQMSIGFYNNYKWIPRWLKTIFIKLANQFVFFVIKIARPISVSRDNPRKNIKTMQESIATLNKKTSIAIFPELSSVKEGVGEFMSGFEHLGKYYYQKTNKRISFYPVFISQKRKTMFIENPIVFDPMQDSNEEKEKIVRELHDSIEKSYTINEKDYFKKRKNK